MIRFLTPIALIALAVPAHAQTPLAGKVQALAEQAQQAAGEKAWALDLDLYRVLAAAGEPLPDMLRVGAGENAMSKGLGVEAEAALAPAVASGAFGGPSDRFAQRDQAMFDAARLDAKGEREGALAANETEAVIKDTALNYIMVGEACIGVEKYADAIRLIDRGLSRGGMTRSEIARANLLRGIAYYRSGDTDKAQAAWSSVDADNGLREIARAWLAISQAS
jgi:tetratricopeptide (TPR) repeat protein